MTKRWRGGLPMIACARTLPMMLIHFPEFISRRTLRIGSMFPRSR
jgi:hypothetical protein